MEVLKFLNILILLVKPFVTRSYVRTQREHFNDLTMLIPGTLTYSILIKHFL